MLTKEQNELLCRVEGAAAMGQLMRRHWLPVCLSEEVAERDGAPVRSRLLGEDLVVFRDTKGRLGVLGEHCLHRRASLAFGRNEECGLRCLYHGWKFDVEGNVVDMPSRAAGHRRAARQEDQGLSGARGRRVRLGVDGPARRDARVRAAGLGAAPGHAHRDREDARRLQLGAGARGLDRFGAQLEPALHQHAARRGRRAPPPTDSAWLRPSNDKAPRMQFQATSYGFRYAAIRKPIRTPRPHAVRPRRRCSSRRSPCSSRRTTSTTWRRCWCRSTT